MPTNTVALAPSAPLCLTSFVNEACKDIEAIEATPGIQAIAKEAIGKARKLLATAAERSSSAPSETLPEGVDEDIALGQLALAKQNLLGQIYAIEQVMQFTCSYATDLDATQVSRRALAKVSARITRLRLEANQNFLLSEESQRLARHMSR